MIFSLHLSLFSFLFTQQLFQNISAPFMSPTPTTLHSEQTIKYSLIASAWLVHPSLRALAATL